MTKTVAWEILPEGDAANLLVEQTGFARRVVFHVRLKTTERVRSVRIGSPGEVKAAGDCRKVLVAMVKEARSNL